MVRKMRRTLGHSLAPHAGDRRVFWLGRSCCTAWAWSSFLPLLQEVSSIYKTRNQLPDSRHCAYAAIEKSKSTVNAQEALLIYDNTEKRRHQGILNMPVVFSANSNRIAYGAE